MKVLKGSLKESRYLSPTSPGAALGVIKEKVYKEGQVTYMADKLGLHKISNTDPENVAVSLHCGCTPFRLLGVLLIWDSVYSTECCERGM
jgi:cysteine dioxygenase